MAERISHQPSSKIMSYKIIGSKIKSSKIMSYKIIGSKIMGSKIIFVLS